MALPLRTNILASYQSLLSTFSDFLIVAIHTILYERAIYPPRTFISTRKYNFPVRQNRHPKVCKWIMDAVAAVEVEMQKGTVDRVAVVIFSPDSKPLERFMFDVSSFPEVPVGEVFTEFDEGDEDDEDDVGNEGIEGDEGTEEPPDGHQGKRFRVNLVDVEEQLRATMRKLAYCGGKLRPLPPGCSYTVVVELKEKADPPIGVSLVFAIPKGGRSLSQHPQPWIPSEPSLQIGEKGGSKRVGSDLGGLKSVPVRLVEAGAFVIEMWIEEGRAKQGELG